MTLYKFLNLKIHKIKAFIVNGKGRERFKNNLLNDCDCILNQTLIKMSDGF